MESSPPRRRTAAGLAVAAIIAVGLGVHLLLPDSAASDIAGDALYAAAAYAGLVLLRPRPPSVVIGAVAAAWCVAVELFQLTGIPSSLAAAFPPVVLLLGTVFDARDLVVYVAAIAVATLVDTAARHRSA